MNSESNAKVGIEQTLSRAAQNRLGILPNLHSHIAQRHDDNYGSKDVA
jgi:hypothetical protein